MNRTTMVTVVVAALAGVVAALVIGPRPLRLGSPAGDPTLAQDAQRILGDRGLGEVAIAVVDGDRTTYAGFGGADQQTAFEIGSVTKALTGMLLAEQVDAGAVRLDQPVGQLVPGTPLAGATATLQELSQHRSGLPRLPITPAFLARMAASQIAGQNPYTGTPSQVLALAGRAGADGRAEPAYSNLGVSALGDALAQQAGTTYPDLLRSRLLGPLGMTRTTVATSAGEVPAGHATGRSATSGRRLAPWLAQGWAPAGAGTWSTTQDLATLARGVLDGSAPGAAAADPSSDYTDGQRIGLGWITSTEQGRTITWHNGATSGFHAFIGLDRERNRAVVVLSASTQSIDAAAIDLLTNQTKRGSAREASSAGSAGSARSTGSVRGAS